MIFKIYMGIKFTGKLQITLTIIITEMKCIPSLG